MRTKRGRALLLNVGHRASPKTRRGTAAEGGARPLHHPWRVESDLKRCTDRKTRETLPLLAPPRGLEKVQEVGWDNRGTLRVEGATEKICSHVVHTLS